MSTDAHSVASSGLGDRAKAPGPRRLYLGAAALAAIVIAAVVILVIKPGGGTSSPKLLNAAVMHRPLTKVYGHVPSYIKIPEPTLPPPATASAAHPDLSQQAGYAVKTTLPHGVTDVFMAGPLLQRSLANNVSTHRVSLNAAVPGTFEVIFSATHGRVPLSKNAFTLITYRGTILHPRMTLANGGPLPAMVPDGKTLKLKMFAKVPEGDGLIRWSPINNKILVGTFWTTEFD
jgi:hypothetical protein